MDIPLGITFSGLLRQIDRRARRLSVTHDIALVPDEVQSEFAEKASYFERLLGMRLEQRQLVPQAPT
jgi:hypothetical protein